MHFPRSRLLYELISHGTLENLCGNSASGCQRCPWAVKVHQQSLAHVQPKPKFLSVYWDHSPELAVHGCCFFMYSSQKTFSNVQHCHTMIAFCQIKTTFTVLAYSNKGYNIILDPQWCGCSTVTPVKIESDAIVSSYPRNIYRQS